ncbi:bifunctional oligoribonuclease/PAP phosphatase NrnA [Candidatus Poribacteria bacterium]|nr:bifunctional oligoribonuclease/PAP phosphatase NrnA [Candidatus Poribacteria bacterium]
MSVQSMETVEESEERIGSAAEVAEVLKNRDHILIVSHVRPDGDCLGSATALIQGLKGLGKTVASYNPSGVPDKLKFIPFVEEVRDKMPEWRPEVTLFVDCGGPSRVTPGFTPIGYCINIDHHATNERFGDLNYIDTGASAVGEQIFHLLEALGVSVTPDMATCIYTSIAADTGSFRYPNTNARTFDMVAALTRAGAKPAWICQQLYESKTREEIELTGRVLNRLNFECGGRLIWSELMWEDYEAVGGEDYEPEGLVSDIRAIDGVEVSILFHELKGGGLRAGLRGKGNVDCAWIAQQFGGGGHFNAAGYFNDKVVYAAERSRMLEAAKRKIVLTLGEK